MTASSSRVMGSRGRNVSVCRVMAHELGLVNGTAATTFSPDQTATREQAAVMLIRLYDSYHAAAPEKTGIA